MHLHYNQLNEKETMPEQFQNPLEKSIHDWLSTRFIFVTYSPDFGTLLINLR
jgi:hypothetical protein